jgi:polyphosphate kinase
MSMESPVAAAECQLTQAGRAELPLAERFAAVHQLALLLDRGFRQLDNAAHQATGEERTAFKQQVERLQASTQDLLQTTLLPALQQQQIYLRGVEQLAEQQLAWLFYYFQRRIHPLLTPLAVDPGHPFPYISSDSLNLLILLGQLGRPGTRTLYARLKIPRQAVPRLIEVPPLMNLESPLLFHDDKRRYWVWSEDIVSFFVHELFPGMSVKGIYQFRVLRAESDLAPGGALNRLKQAPVVRLDMQATMPPAVQQWLITRLDAPNWALFVGGTPVDLTSWGEVAQRLGTLPAKFDALPSPRYTAR